ncbi:GNAT family N-acetyltransferase [Sphingomonas immobilis]|uniref:GNAT family N-acetyltransferase n=1 Tax=Sphingomonas immobilis TaxID=3063997 RepID=A0ABT9A0K7_9SPHN|nr:GNAT family N-acetyltransferase [Sphingomonas sp. CA1-15]MDO7842987.1 GNAT family N-acetyltransferase [Sphingomonas sp. CA1-15]
MIDTERLILRGWREADVAPFHAMGNDPEVMRYLGEPLSLADAEAAAARQNDFIASHGYCFWAVERRSDGAFLGFCGLKPGPEGTPIVGQIEVGWRLARAAWGQGYAREAAQASLDWAWANLDAAEVAAITVIGNDRSWGLMERLGMRRVPSEDFEHPVLPVGHALRPHITYRIARPVQEPGNIA